MFSIPKEVRLNSTHYLIAKIHKKIGRKGIPINHSADTNYKDFINIYRKFTSELFSFFTIDTILSANNPSRFRKNLLDSLYK